MGPGGGCCNGILVHLQWIFYARMCFPLDEDLNFTTFNVDTGINALSTDFSDLAIRFGCRLGFRWDLIYDASPGL